jgi:predicted ATPase/DNA-binding SARP family transcriptional activator
VDLSAHLALHLLGALRLELNNALIVVDRRKTLALLAYLAVNHWQHHRDHISAMLWPEYSQSKAYTNLRHILWEVQQVIGEGWIDAHRDTIRLIADDDHASSQTGRVVWVDVARFKSQITQSRAQKDVVPRIPLLSEAVKLYRDHFLTGFSLKDSPNFNDWVITESEDLRHQFASVLTILSNDHCSLGQADIAIPYARRLIALDPLNEASHRQLMQIYIQAGQHNAALKQYQICEQILRKELGVDPQPETRALYKQIRKGEVKSTQPVTQKELSAPPHNLPYQISTFIGRERELDEVTDLMANHRLVTLVGTGGIGKTRLSLKVAEGLLRNFANGIWFAELAPLSDPARVPQTIASLFGLIERSEASLTETLIRFLRSKTVLLILDNCEHVLDACAQIADTLLKNCPNLKILTTSRAPFEITGEARYHVPPLALPDRRQILERLLDFESIQLFDERARLVQEAFSLTMENASSIAEICHRLDGIPLAIELAAARVSMYSTDQIAIRLDESFNLLTGGSRTALPRQQTLRASIEWSWNLLPEPECILLRRLSVFAGGWTLEAAESVCAGNGIEPRQVSDVLTQLVAKSLVVINQGVGRARRYHLLEMIREYACEKLVEADEEEGIQDQHLKYFLKLSEQIEPELLGPQQMEWFARTNEERNNLRAALEHAVRTDVEAGLYISGRLEHFWRSQDNREGARWLAEFLQMPESKEYPHARAKALHTQGRILFNFEQYDEAQAATEESLMLFRAVGDQYGEVDSLVSLGFIFTLGSIADPAKGAELVQQGLALARSLGDIWRQAWALCILGWDHSNFKRAFAYWEEAITLYRQVGHLGRLADTLSELGFFLLMNGQIDASQKCLDESSLLLQQLNIKGRRNHLLSAYGQIALMRGEYEQARGYFREDAAKSNESGGRIEYLWALVRLGLAELRAGNITAARQILTETAQNFQQDGSSIGVVVSLEWMASLDIAVNKAEVAARLIGWSDATREIIRDSRPLLEQADVDRDIAAVVVMIGDAAFQEAYEKGCDMTIDEAVAYALEE